MINFMTSPTGQALETSYRKTTTILIKNLGREYLAVSRKDDHTKFDFPGGKVEEGETPEQCAIRELKEETGLDVVSIHLVDVRPYRNGYTSPAINEMVYCYMVVAKGTLKQQEGEGLVRWQPLKEFFKGAFGDYNREVAKALKLK